MKKYLFSSILILFGSLAIAGNQKNGSSTSTINANDTIVIDLSNQLLVGGKISFPVSINSDDTIYALDFSFKYNQTNFTYDTILNISPLLQSNCYYNTADSTVRYTSFSLDSLAQNTALVTVRLNTFSSYMCNQDINSIKGFLNGDVCSIKLINCLSAGVDDLPIQNKFVVYPNPTNEFITIEVVKNSTLSLSDVNGKIIFEPTSINKDEKFQLSTRTFKNGVYFLKVYNNHFVAYKKIIVQH